MTVHIVGRRSYLAGILVAHLGADHAVVHHAADGFDPERAGPDDWIVNCAFDPVLHREPIGADLGTDGAIARAIAGEGAGPRFVMLSSRAVYAPRVDPPLREDEPCAPVTPYGRNKVAVEEGLRALLGERLLVLRLANVFGAEPAGRHTFVSMALGTLVEWGAIELRMARETRKDFLPAAFLGRAVSRLLSAGATGTINIGSGVTVTAGEVADALVRGFGSGRIDVTTDERGEEFLLDTTRLRRHTGLATTREALLQDLEKTAREQRR